MCLTEEATTERQIDKDRKTKRTDFLLGFSWIKRQIDKDRKTKRTDLGGKGGI